MTKSTNFNETLRKYHREMPLTAMLGNQTPFSTNLFKKSINRMISSYKGKRKFILRKNSSTLKLLLMVMKEDARDCYSVLPKYGADNADQMVRLNTIIHGSLHWPMHIFFIVLGMPAINPSILYKKDET